MTDRRNFLKLFGVGAVVAPIAAGMPLDKEAIIVKPPEVELVTPPGIVSPQDAMRQGFFGQDLLEVTVYIRNARTNTVAKMRPTSISSRATTRYDFPAYIDKLNYRASIDGRVEMEAGFILTGEMHCRQL